VNLVSSLQSFFTRPTAVRRPVVRHAHHGSNGYRPRLEPLEDRTIPSASPALAPPVLAAAAVAPAAQQLTTMIPLSITGIAVQNGQLVAQGLLGSTPFTAPLLLSTSPNPGGDCPILHLRINAIHLDVLGLQVDTSNICLDITAHHDQGLLGDLLCGVSNALNGGTPLGDVLGGLTTTNLNTITGGLTNVLNNVLGQITAPSAVTGATGNILHLSLGPVDLNLLGLEVGLDNCANGPVTVDITAVPGAGNLLGNLLGGLSHLLDGNAANPALLNKLGKIAHTIEGLL